MIVMLTSPEPPAVDRWAGLNVRDSSGGLVAIAFGSKAVLLSWLSAAWDAATQLPDLDDAELEGVPV